MSQPFSLILSSQLSQVSCAEAKSTVEKMEVDPDYKGTGVPFREVHD